MKGFVRILEAIIASIIILTSLTFFFNLSLSQSNWGDAFLQIRAQDILTSLEKNGTLTAAVENNNPVLLDAIITNSNLSFLPYTADYSFEVKGLPNPIIYVGCDCSPDEITNLTDMLSPLTFTYHGRQIQIRIASATINNIPAKTNIFFMFGYKDLTAAGTQINNFLGNGGTLFLVADLTKQQVNDGVLNTTFGLKWVDSLAGSRSGQFLGWDNENTTAFKVYKYYNNLTGNDNTITFNFNTGTSIALDNRTVIAGNGASLAKTNKEIVTGSGRTVWLSNYTETQNNNLTKAMLLWASGEDFSLDTTQKSIQPHHVQARVFVYDQDVYEVILTLWNVLNQG